MKYRLLFGLIIFTQTCIIAQSNKYNQIMSSNSHDDQHMLHYPKFPNNLAEDIIEQCLKKFLKKLKYLFSIH